MRENLKGAKAAILFVGIATLVMSLAGAMMPALTRVFVYRVLSGRSPSWATGITVLMAILCIVMLVTGWTQSVYQMKLFGLLGIKSGTRYMWHVFHLPQQFFFQRNPGDLQQNEAATQVIAQIIIKQIVPLAINTVMMVYYAVVMLLYSLFDGKNMKEIPKSLFWGSLSVIDQRIVLFRDTIANNIRMWDSSIEDFEVIMAARDAQIHDDIMKRRSGYEYY